MATIAASQPVSQPVPTSKYDRRFYSTMAIAMALTVLIGFGPTYYFRAISPGPMTTFGNLPFTAIVHLHAALFTTWVLLFIVQTALVAAHRVKVHRTLGIAGGVIGGLMVVAGVVTAVNSAARGAAPPGIEPLRFMTIPLGDMVLFSMFLGSALWWRNNKEAHKRLMLLAYTSIVVAAVARWPHVVSMGPLGFYGLSLTFIIAGVVYDLVTRRRVHPAYLWGGALFIVMVPLRLFVAGTDAWYSFAQMLVNMAS